MIMIAITANTIFKGLLASFLVFASAEIVKRGSAADFLPLGWLLVLLLASGVVAVAWPEEGKGRVYPLISALLTFLVLWATIVFTWKAGNNLGKIIFLIIAGAVTVVSGTLKVIFEHEESR